jgi:hypothetical protein
VYKSFFQNLPTFIEDMDTVRSNEVGIAEERNKIGSVTFVIRMAGTVDVLAHNHQEAFSRAADGQPTAMGDV